VVVDGPAPFVTDVRYSLPDGRSVHWQARRQRKAATGARGLTWWIGLLFAVGSACFVVGPIPAYAEAVGAHMTALTFFIGSVFFTTAAYLSYVQVVRESGHRWFGWAPHHMGFWATSIQLVGTLYFNMTTFAGLFGVPADLADRVIWRPDAIGSVCSSSRPRSRSPRPVTWWWSWRPGERDWHITALNLWGSVFFGLSAVGAYIQPSGSLTNVQLANAGTFLGAVCFLIASVLMMPEGRGATAPAPTLA